MPSPTDTNPRPLGAAAARAVEWGGGAPEAGVPFCFREAVYGVWGLEKRPWRLLEP